MDYTAKIRTPDGGGWFYTPNALYTKFQFPDRQKPYLIAVYGYLSCCANVKGVCWPTEKTISLKTGMSERTVRNIIKELDNRHMILIKRKSINNKTKNVYQLLHTNEWMMINPWGAVNQRHKAPPNKTKENNINNYNNLSKELTKKLIIPSLGGFSA